MPSGGNQRANYGNFKQFPTVKEVVISINGRTGYFTAVDQILLKGKSDIFKISKGFFNYH